MACNCTGACRRPPYRCGGDADGWFTTLGGMKLIVSGEIPSGELRIVQDGRVVGKIINISDDTASPDVNQSGAA